MLIPLLLLLFILLPPSLRNFADASPSREFMATEKLKEKMLNPYARTPPTEKEGGDTEEKETCSSSLFDGLARPPDSEFVAPLPDGVEGAAALICERCRLGESACGAVKADLKNSFGGEADFPSPPKASPAAFVLYYEALMDKWRDLRGPVALVPKQRKTAFDSALDVAGKIYGGKFADDVKKAYAKRAAAQSSFGVPAAGREEI